MIDKLVLDKNTLHRRIVKLGLVWFLAILAAIITNNALAIERTYVLVHGAYVGAWYWKPVVTGLQSRGHKVISADLTGHGKQAAENSRHITLEQHIEDVVAAINSSDQPVILVSHSYGGRPATGAWDRARENVKAVIYLEAMAPYGQGRNVLPFDHIQRKHLKERMPSALESGLIQPPAQVQDRYPDEVVVPQSIEALHGAVLLKNGLLPNTPGAYVIGSRSSAKIFRTYGQFVGNQRGWTIYEIETGHDMVFDNSDVVIRLLDDLGAQLSGQ